MNKCVRILVILLSTVLLFGCTNSHGYRYQLIEKENGYFIRVESDEVSVGGPDGNTAYITFQNFDEMRNDIQKGNFGEWEFWRLMANIYVDYEEEGELPVCDLDKLYALAYPEDETAPVILWCGPYYYHEMETKFGKVMAFHSVSYIESSMDRYRMAVTPDALAEFEVSDIQAEGDRNATAYYWTNWQGEHKSLFYELEKDGRTYMVREDFDLYDDDYVEGVPSYIRIYFEVGGYSASIIINDSFNKSTERPSVEWLTSFDFHEYVAE